MLAIKNAQKYLAEDEVIKKEITREMESWEVLEGVWVGHYFQKLFRKLLLVVCHVVKSNSRASDWFRTHPDFVSVQRYFERECFNNHNGF